MIEEGLKEPDVSRPIPEFALPVLERMDTLLGDLRDAMLDRLRTMPQPWSTMSEARQREYIAGVEQVARHLVTQACTIIAANGYPAYRVSPTGFKRDKEGVCIITLKSDAHDNKVGHALLDHEGPAMLVLASPETYMGETKPAQVDVDEPPLPIGDGDVVKFRGKDATTAVRRGRGRPPKETTVQPITYVPPSVAPMKDTVRATSIKELLNERHPQGATLAMIINAGLHSSELTEEITAGRVEKREDGYYIWISAEQDHGNES